ncbi:hypothetical protein ACFQ6C_07785 [Streptomyces sp. NPDC056454]
MSVDPIVDPSLVHRLQEPKAWAVVADWLASQEKPPVPETFRGPNWQKD